MKNPQFIWPKIWYSTSIDPGIDMVFPGDLVLNGWEWEFWISTCVQSGLFRSTSEAPILDVAGLLGCWDDYENSHGPLGTAVDGMGPPDGPPGLDFRSCWQMMTMRTCMTCLWRRPPATSHSPRHVRRWSSGTLGEHHRWHHAMPRFTNQIWYFFASHGI